MSIDDDIAFLNRVPTLALLGREPLRILAISAESRYVHEGDVLFREGEPADGAFVVQEGSFTLTSEHISPGLEPVTIGAGTLLGELALLTGTVRPVTATALEASSVIRIPRTLFLRMLDGYPDAAQRLRTIIAKRADQAITDIQSVRPVLDIAD
jgi:CRP-like cAMP-binding protein